MAIACRRVVNLLCFSTFDVLTFQSSQLTPQYTAGPLPMLLRVALVARSLRSLSVHSTRTLRHMSPLAVYTSPMCRRVVRPPNVSSVRLLCSSVHHTPTASPGVDFAALGVLPSLCVALNRAGIVAPTPIQQSSIPQTCKALRDGQDVLVRAATGSGKTLVYLLPVLTVQQQSADAYRIVVRTRYFPAILRTPICQMLK